MPPNDVLRAILTAPVDLLWNGGIGTYVKASTESNTDVGDRANDAIRVNGADLRARVVGEGGNLGLTQLGRIEAARAGVALNTDAIDNSAGVDTSDHEVNIKILLDRVVAAGDLQPEERDPLLRSMTDDVAAMVLTDNVDQNVLLTFEAHHGAAMIPAIGRLIRSLERTAGLDRELEFLPSDAGLAALASEGGKLTNPGAGGAGRLHEARPQGRLAGLDAARRGVHRPVAARDTSPRPCRHVSGSTSTDIPCAGRSSPPAWSTRWSIAVG